MARQKIFQEISRASVSAARKTIGVLVSGARELLYPPFCRICGSSLENPCVVCSRCAHRIRRIGNACSRCGMPVLNPSARGGCSECDRRTLWFDRAFSAGVYEGPLCRLILLNKNRGDLAVQDYLLGLLERLWREKLAPAVFPDSVFDPRQLGVVPVPRHPVKAFLRHRDSVAELARGFSSRTGIAFRPVLRRARWTLPQTSLPRGLRLKNPARSFKVYRKASPPRDALLVDDVVTTCATISEAARALRESGTHRVYVLSLGRTLH